MPAVRLEKRKERFPVVSLKCFCAEIRKWKAYQAKERLPTILILL